MIVVGDVNSTMACTITAKKLGIRVAEEIVEVSRVVIDVAGDQ